MSLSQAESQSSSAAADKRLAPIYLLDGGLGTTLADQHHCVFDSSTPLWSSQLLLSSPSTLLAAQRDFAAAGADVILTATYQASFEGFRAVAREGEAGRYMRSAVRIAREAFGGEGRRGRGGGRVALSLGAYGATMVPSQEYEGRYDGDRKEVEGLRRWHGRRMAVFFAGDGEEGTEVDEESRREAEECWRDIEYVAFETLPLLVEVLAVREVMFDVSRQGKVGEEQEKEFWISCVFPGEGNGLPDGSSVRDVVKAMVGKRQGAKVPFGIGINCTKVGKVEALINEFESAVKELMEQGELGAWPSLVVYPDGTDGEVYNTTTKEWERAEESRTSSISWDQTIFDFVSRARQRNLWKSIFVGGCCKTTPEDIAKLRMRIDQV